MNLDKLRSGAPQERRGLFRFMQFTTCMVVFLLLAGAAVKSTNSGLAVPDWPLSFGKLMPEMKGGVFFEHGHRMVATTVGFLTIIFAVWFWMRDPRPALRRLGWIALGMVVLQGVLGGVTVLLKLPAVVSSAHACLAQAFFMVVVFMTLSLSRGWNAERPVRGPSGTSLPLLATLTTAAVYIQLILGAVTRHLEAALVIPDFPLVFGRLVPPVFTPEIAVHYAHRLGAVVVSILVISTAVSAFRLPDRRGDLRWPAGLLVVETAVQITLGGLIILTHRHPHPTTTHVVVGAIILATSLVLTARTWRFIGVPLRSGARSALREATA